VVFGRVAGKSAGTYVQGKSDAGKLSLDHVRKYHQELEAAGVGQDRVAPMILPDYTPADIKKKQWTAHYEGTLR
jgi:hypothetical protein